MPEVQKSDDSRIPKLGVKKLMPPGMPKGVGPQKSEKSSSPKNSSDVGPRQSTQGGTPLDPRYNA